MWIVNSPLDNALTVTYETGKDEPIHPDFMVAMRFIEIGMSDCAYGCKIYADPRSNVKVLAHMGNYGCDVTRAMLDREIERSMAQTRDPDWLADVLVGSVMADLTNMLGVRA